MIFFVTTWLKTRSMGSCGWQAGLWVLSGVGLVWAQRVALCQVALAATGAYWWGRYWESCGAEASWKKTDAEPFWFFDYKLQSVFGVSEESQYSMTERTGQCTHVVRAPASKFLSEPRKDGQLAESLAQMRQTATIQICRGASPKADQYLKE